MDTEVIGSQRRPRQVEELEVNEVADGAVIYQPSRDRVHFLNATAAVVFELCTGENTPEEITSALHVAFGLTEFPDEEVATCLSQLRAESLIE